MKFRVNLFLKNMAQQNHFEIIKANIAKPLNDHRTYQFLVLDNALEVLLVSDPETQKSAAAMDVRVGHFQDPDVSIL